jgi:aspartate kinase
MLTVEKIGGTSMSQFQDVMQNIIKGNCKGDELYNRIFVVSAYNNVTNWLLEHKKTGEPGIYNKFLNGEDYSIALDQFCQRLLLINDGFADYGLDLKEARDFIRFCVD